MIARRVAGKGVGGSKQKRATPVTFQALTSDSLWCDIVIVSFQNFTIAASITADSQDWRCEYEISKANLLHGSGEGWLLLFLPILLATSKTLRMNGGWHHCKTSLSAMA